MRVLSVKQPFAALIISGRKPYEYRTFSTPFRGQIAIHASSSPVKGMVDQAWSHDGLAETFVAMGWADEDDIKALPRMAVVGVCDLVNVIDAHDAWPKASEYDRDMSGWGERPARGEQFWWELRAPLAITPVPCKGKLNLWTLDADTASTVAKRAKTGVPPSAQKVTAAAKRRAMEAREAYEQEVNRLYVPSKALAVIVGKGPMRERDVYNLIVEHIDSHQLYGAPERRLITLDKGLQGMCGNVKQLDIMEVLQRARDLMTPVE
jgi:activating signal cointegrator 1